MSTPDTMPPDRGEKVADLLLNVRRHGKGLDKALDELERALMGKPTTKAEPATDEK